MEISNEGKYTTSIKLERNENLVIRSSDGKLSMNITAPSTYEVLYVNTTVHVLSQDIEKGEIVIGISSEDAFDKPDMFRHLFISQTILSRYEKGVSALIDGTCTYDEFRQVLKDVYQSSKR